jgi:nitrogen fixation-related uncharacterized protein
MEELVIPSSLTVILATLALGVVALTAFIVAWWCGHFRDLDAQARVIFDSRELRFVRPWETSAQRLEREVTYGAPLTGERGEWGGAT